MCFSLSKCYNICFAYEGNGNQNYRAGDTPSAYECIVYQGSICTMRVYVASWVIQYTVCTYTVEPLLIKIHYKPMSGAR